QQRRLPRRRLDLPLTPSADVHGRSTDHPVARPTSSSGSKCRCPSSHRAGLALATAQPMDRIAGGRRLWVAYISVAALSVLTIGTTGCGSSGSSVGAGDAGVHGADATATDGAGFPSDDGALPDSGGAMVPDGSLTPG